MMSSEQLAQSCGKRSAKRSAKPSANRRSSSREEEPAHGANCAKSVGPTECTSAEEADARPISDKSPVSEQRIGTDTSKADYSCM
jgi:hypothetical protein